jgi:hypothetical protein
MELKLKQRGRGAGVVALAVLALALLGPSPQAARAQEDKGYWIQVFAQSGPMCPVVVLGEECPDALLAGVELVLEKRIRKRGVFREVARFVTNANGYAELFVDKRGIYRVDVSRDRSPGPSPAGPPFLQSPVTFRVPARHQTVDGFRLTPVVVSFDSGIR